MSKRINASSIAIEPKVVSDHFCSSVRAKQAQTCRSCDNHQLPVPMSSHHPLFPNNPVFACIFRFLAVWVTNFFTSHPIKASLETGPFISNQFLAKRTPSCSGRSQETKAHSLFLHSILVLSRYLIPSIRHYIVTVVMSTTASWASPLPPHLLRSDPSRCIVVLKDPFVRLCERANNVHDSEIQEIMSNLIKTSKPSSFHDPRRSRSSRSTTLPVDEITNRFLQMEARFDHLNSEITGLNSEITGLNNEITGLKTENTGLKVIITRLDNENTGLKNEITGLNSKITGLNNNITGLNNTITRLDNENTGLKTEITGLNSKITGLNNNITRLDNENMGLKIEITGLNNKIKRDLEERLETLEHLGWVRYLPSFDLHATSLMTIIGWRGRDSHSHPRLDR